MELMFEDSNARADAFAREITAQMARHTLTKVVENDFRLVPEWHSLGEVRPPYDRCVLLLMKRVGEEWGPHEIGMLVRREGEDKIDAGSLTYELSDFSHWMILPEVPEEA